MKQRRKRSMLMTMLLTLAMVFTMMPAMAFADDSIEPDANLYFKEVSELANGCDYVAAEDITIPQGETEVNAVLAIYDNDYQSQSVRRLEGKVLFFADGTDNIIKTEDNKNSWHVTGNTDDGWRFKSQSQSQYVEFYNYNTHHNELYTANNGTALVYNENKLSGVQSNTTYYIYYDKTAGAEGFRITTAGEGTPEADSFRLFKRAFRVQYGLNGHGSAVPEDEYVEQGELVTKPDDPDEKSFDFVGWYENGATDPFDFDKTIEENKVLVASWKYSPEKVKAAKKAAKDKITEAGSESNLAKYEDVQQKDILGLISSYTAQVYSEMYVEDIEALVAEFEAAIAAVPTTEALGVNAKSAVDAARVSAKLEAAAYANSKNLKNYKDAQQKTIMSAVVDADAKIDAAKSVEEIKAITDKLKAKIAALPTKADYDKMAKKGVKTKSAKAGKKKMTVRWAPKKKAFDGYQIKYRVKGTKDWKAVEVKGAKKAKKVIKKLRKGKNYQVKVRGYKLYGLSKTIHVYGKYSKTLLTKKIK